MSYYDPKVYDPSKLTGDGAAVMRGFDLCVAIVLDVFSDLAEGGVAVECHVPLFDELYSQVGADMGMYVRQRLNYERTELTVTLMESDPERYAVE